MLIRFIEESFQKRNKDTAMESWSIGKTESTRAAGQTTREMAKDMRDTQMEIHMKEISKKERPMVKVFIIGQMERFMMENGVKE